MKLHWILFALIFSGCFLNPYGTKSETDCSFTNSCSTEKTSTPQTDCEKYADLTDPTAMGDGGSSPYEIYSVDQLNSISDNSSFMSANFKIMCDLDLTGVTWNPIGSDTSAANRYAGTFDGNNKTISNLTFNGSQANYGFFGVTGAGTIKNIVLSNVNITNSDTTANKGTGALVGYVVDTTIQDCSSSGSISAFSFAGGLIGYVTKSGSGATITRTSSSVNVECTSPNSSWGHCGGLVSYLFSGANLSNSFATGNVGESSQTGAWHYGGLVGVMMNSSSISNSYATGNVYGYEVAGGLVGSMCATCSITGSFSTGNVNIDNTRMSGGFLGVFGKTTNVSSELNNVHWVDSSTDTDDCYFYDYSGTPTYGNTNCTKQASNSYFYSSTNEPYVSSGWDTSVWQWSGTGFPTLQ